MRISDWSSDVCSSDLPDERPSFAFAFFGRRRIDRGGGRVISVVSGFGGALQGRIQWGFIGLLAIALPHRTVLSCSPTPSAAWHPQWGAERRQCTMASRHTVPGSPLLRTLEVSVAQSSSLASEAQSAPATRP